MSTKEKISTPQNSKYNNWAVTKVAALSFTEPTKKIILSFNNLE